jgi:four helix bundle protein
MAVDREAALVRKFVELAKLLNVYLNHFPRHERYALSTRIRNAAYSLYDLIVEGQKRYHKKTTLTQLDIAHEQLRMQLYLAYELGYFRFTAGRRADDAEAVEARRWAAVSRIVDELGRMIGGWIRHELASETKDEKKGTR